MKLQLNQRFPRKRDPDEDQTDGQMLAESGLDHRHGAALPDRSPSGRLSRNAVTNSAVSGGTIALPYAMKNDSDIIARHQPESMDDPLTEIDGNIPG